MTANPLTLNIFNECCVLLWQLQCLLIWKKDAFILQVVTTGICFAVLVMSVINLVTTQATVNEILTK